jgi:hypothetical protein
MNAPTWAIKLALDFGVMGLFALAMYLGFRMISRWTPKMLGAMMAQTDAVSKSAVAVTDLATVVREGQGDQREVLIAVRVLADRIDSQRKCLAAIEENCKRRACE